ncbi:MAG TPA: hypothetical protein DDZ73_15625 [Gammaproteobacteria bacterium]|nr:hypothetical protein [Gammaproteobacteria bacterium]HBK77775.1 hypothetical protein [Gammaproteobacteria bacterium]
MWAVGQNHRLTDLISCYGVVELAGAEPDPRFVHVAVQQLYRSDIAVRVCIATNCVLIIGVEFW